MNVSLYFYWTEAENGECRDAWEYACFDTIKAAKAAFRKRSNDRGDWKKVRRFDVRAYVAFGFRPPIEGDPGWEWDFDEEWTESYLGNPVRRKD